MGIDFTLFVSLVIYTSRNYPAYNVDRVQRLRWGLYKQDGKVGGLFE